jgi:hypothetical protein
MTLRATAHPRSVGCDEMKAKFTVVLIFFVGASCCVAATNVTDKTQQVVSGTGIPLLDSPNRLTVDAFIAAIKIGWTLDDLKSKLGVRTMSSFKMRYSLPDG